MAAISLDDASPLMSAEQAIQALEAARIGTLALVAPLSDEELEAVHSPLMSPLVWDLGHIAAYEDLWLVHRHAAMPLLRPELAELYDAFETPRAVRGRVRMLRRDEAHEYLDQVRRHALEALERVGMGDGLVHEMVIQHEHQHGETMLQTLSLARLPRYRPPRSAHASDPARAAASAGDHTGLETVEVPAGPFAFGAPAHRFSYDNERPRHRVAVPDFAIGRTPVTNATWLSFAEGGGYERREWWSDEGWAWKEEYDISRPGGWVTDSELHGSSGASEGRALKLRGRSVYEWRLGGPQPLDPDRPVVHVSWYEADAFARAHGVRLPTEAEWEKAATWDPRTGETRDWPWGEGPPSPEQANLLDGGEFGTAPAGSRPAGASPCGALGMLGDVWEWTGSAFGGYAGFVAHPYREYSEVFFGDAYRALRGGSWATSARVANPTFRNWDFPERRQIFAGVRIARDA
jgi:iron(II)-dependent oxidoreductase